MWTNLLDGKKYVGSSMYLRKRLGEYFNANFLAKYNNMYIYRALFKHGYSNFKLEILEYCDPSMLLERENYYLKLLKPEYNILQVPGSSLDRKLTQEQKKCHNLSQSSEGTWKYKIVKTNTTTVYNSVNAAARALNIYERRISEYFFRVENGSTKPYKGRYVFRKI